MEDPTGLCVQPFSAPPWSSAPSFAVAFILKLELWLSPTVGS